MGVNSVSFFLVERWVLQYLLAVVSLVEAANAKGEQKGVESIEHDVVERAVDVKTSR